MNLKTHEGYGMTKHEYEMYRAKIIAEDNQKKFRNPITDEDIAYLVKALEAPVDLFVKII